MTALVWLLPALPLASFLVLALAGRRLPRAWVAGLGVGSVAAAAGVAIALAAWFWAAPPPGQRLAVVLWQWFAAADFAPRVLLVVDPLSLVMVLVVTVIGALIHLYSAEYMADDPDRPRFFAAMNLFVTAMLVLVLAGDLLLLYLGWEGVGLCSYLLIGFWYRDPANGRAAQKAFVVTRVGDAALALGLFLLFQWHGTLEIAPLLERATATWAVGSGAAIAAAALLLGGAVGKSAQLPLQVWLPDAMAGPTPVSALIHAATMVTAGVYLIARTHPLFELAPPVMTATAAIGAATLLLAGASALAQRDIKRVLAWSTISQLGYMFLALGVGAWSAAIFHLVTHACFKALLFLGAGAVLLGLHHEQDLRRMGGLRRVLPVTFATFVVGSAALAGVPLVTAGFYSKDLILWRAWGAGDAGPWLWVVGLLGAGLTALYVFRAVFLAFAGRARWTPDPAHGVPHRPGWRVHVPLVVLAVLSVVTGFLETPAVLGGVTWFSDALAPVLGPAPGAFAAGGGPTDAAAAPHDLGLELALLGATAVVALGGIALAWWAHRRRDPAEARAPGLPAGAERFLRDGWGFDTAYGRLLVRPFARLSRANAADAVDLWARGVARLMGALHAGLRRTQTGALRWYAGALLAGAALFAAAALIGGGR